MRTFFKWLTLLTLTVVAVGFVAFSAFYAKLAYEMKHPNKILGDAQGEQITDKDGRLLFELVEEDGRRIPVDLEDISPHLIHATVSTEDDSFWSNTGINVGGIASAAYENLAPWNEGLLNGRGGSSISQQLAKNLYIEPADRVDRDPLRKLKETVYAFELNRRYSKQQILEWYLNEIFYGNFAIGAEAASIRYFGKSASDLTLPEAALLASLPKAPALYDPFEHIDLAKARQETVLDLMVDHGYLLPEQAEQAKTAPLDLRPSPLPMNAPHFATRVVDIVEDGGIEAEDDLVIQTTLDLDLQEAAEDAVAWHISRTLEEHGYNNAAVVAIDPQTGRILAMVGSADFLDESIDGQVNNAISPNQPASTVKPFVYLSAFENGWSPATRIPDRPVWVTGPEGSFKLTNSRGGYRGEVSVREALQDSLTVPAVRAMGYAGTAETEHLMRSLGLDSSEDAFRFGHGYALGAADVNLLELTHAYSVLANNGVMAGQLGSDPYAEALLQPIAIDHIRSGDEILWEVEQTEERAVEESYTYLVTNVLSQAYADARVENQKFNQPAAFMSGLSDGNRDAWAVGYTSELAIGVWVGRSDNARIEDPGGPGIARNIWEGVMAAAHGESVPDFMPPDSIDFVRLCKSTGSPPTDDCSEVVIEPVPLTGEDTVASIREGVGGR